VLEIVYGQPLQALHQLIYLPLVVAVVADHLLAVAVVEAKLFPKQVLLQLEPQLFLWLAVVQEVLEVIPRHKITVRPVVEVVT
jgi:hypothetical protein